MSNLETDAFELKRLMKQEAHEKAFEVLVRGPGLTLRQVVGQRMFEKERDKMVAEEVESVQEEFEKKLRNISMARNIERSTKINALRLEKMNSRDKLIQRLIVESKEHLGKTLADPANPKYARTLQQLIVQVSGFSRAPLCRA